MFFSVFCFKHMPFNWSLWPLRHLVVNYFNWMNLFLWKAVPTLPPYPENSGGLGREWQNTVRTFEILIWWCFWWGKKKQRLSFLNCISYLLRSEGGMRRGYMGHLTRIANTVVHNLEKGPVHTQISSLIKGVCGTKVRNSHHSQIN